MINPFGLFTPLNINVTLDVFGSPRNNSGEIIAKHGKKTFFFSHGYLDFVVYRSLAGNTMQQCHISCMRNSDFSFPQRVQPPCLMGK